AVYRRLGRRAAESLGRDARLPGDVVAVDVIVARLDLAARYHRLDKAADLLLAAIAGRLTGQPRQDGDDGVVVEEVEHPLDVLVAPLGLERLDFHDDLGREMWHDTTSSAAPPAAAGDGRAFQHGDSWHFACLASVRARARPRRARASRRWGAR